VSISRDRTQAFASWDIGCAEQTRAAAALLRRSSLAGFGRRADSVVCNRDVEVLKDCGGLFVSEECTVEVAQRCGSYDLLRSVGRAEFGDGAHLADPPKVPFGREAPKGFVCFGDVVDEMEMVGVAEHK
jgi:hypothetical protein